MKKRIIGRILAVGLAALLMLPVVSACKTDEEPDKEPAEAERDMTLPPSVEDVVLPSVPEGPIFFGESYIFSVLDLVKRAKFYLVSGEELDPTELRVTLPDCYFYYSVNIEQLDTSGGAVISDVELLMEYNQADWQGLYDLWYEEGPGAYAAAIEAWEELYYAVESEIPPLYCYVFQIQEVEEDAYRCVTEDPEQALADQILWQKTYELYKAGNLRYYTPTSEEEKVLTKAEIDFGDRVEVYEFGGIYVKSYFDQRQEEDENFEGFVYSDDRMHIGASVLGEQEWEGRDTVTINHMTCVHLETEGEREYGELTLKRYECPELQRHGLEIEKIEVRYISLLGVETAMEWDGNSDLTIPIWNYIEGDEDFCRFCIFVTLKGDFLKGSDFNLYLESFLTLGFEDKVFSIHAVSSVYEPKMRGVRSQINEIYAEIVDGVDVGARERILGNTVMNRKSPAGYFMSNKYERSYKVTTWWQRYVSQMTRI